MLEEPAPEATPRPEFADLGALLGRPGAGVHWTLGGPGDLNANLVNLGAGEAIADHVNREVDVLFVLLAGGARITVDGTAHPISPPAVAHVPRGAHRAVAAGPDGLSYLSIHCRRSPLTVGSARS